MASKRRGRRPLSPAEQAANPFSYSGAPDSPGIRAPESDEVKAVGEAAVEYQAPLSFSLGPELSSRLRLAAFARSEAGPVTILLAAEEPGDTGPLREQCASWLEGQELSVPCRYASMFLASALITAARVQPASVLVIARDCSWLDEKTIESLVLELDYPVAIVW